MYDSIVIGAGMSGLSVAYGLHRRNANVLLVEAQDRAGGSIRSEITSDGFVLENGPNTVLTSDPKMLEHFAELGIADERLVADRRGARRYLFFDGKLELLPSSPGTFFGTRLLSTAGKLRLFAEPLLPRATTPDESVAAFFTRRIGAEPAERIVDPFVAGIYAGHPKELSIEGTFPTLWEAEQEYGSVLIGMIARQFKGKKTARGRSEMISFQHGLATWPLAMSQAIGTERVWLNTKATKIQYSDDQRWLVTVSREGREEVLQTARVILTVPTDVSAKLIGELDPATAQVLYTFPYPPLMIVHLGYRRDDVEHPMDGFGMLCPSREQRKVLGTLWPSTLFPGRTPEGAVLTTSFVGGSRQPELTEQDDEEVIEMVIREQQSFIGAHRDPFLARVVRKTRSIPQYVGGHAQRMEAINRIEAMWPGLHITGNYRDGVSVEKCWHKGQELADKISG